MPPSDEYRFTKLIDCSRIHWRAFSRLPAAIRFELDWLLARALPAPSLPNDEEVVEWCDEDDDDWRPQRAGLSDARKEVVLDEAPEKREREEDEGVFRPEEDPRVVALLISSCMTDEVDDEPGVVVVDPPLDMGTVELELPAAAAAASSWRDLDLLLLWDFRLGGTLRLRMSETLSWPGL